MEITNKHLVASNTKDLREQIRQFVLTHAASADSMEALVTCTTNGNTDLTTGWVSIDTISMKRQFTNAGSYVVVKLSRVGGGGLSMEVHMEGMPGVHSYYIFDIPLGKPDKVDIIDYRFYLVDLHSTWTLRHVVQVLNTII